MDLETIKLTRDGGVARLELHRPDAAHAVNDALARDLMSAAIEVDEDPQVRAVVITATGRMFCVGGDLAQFHAAGEKLPALLKQVTANLHAGISRLARMRAPVIAGVNGAAAGAGFSLVCACDLAVAAESAKLSMAYTRIGMTPDGSGTWFLPRLIGSRRALELMLLNRALSAAEAADWGIVNEVVPDDQLDQRVMELAHQLAEGPTEAFAGVKRLMQLTWTEGFESQMEHESRGIADAARTRDGREGIAAFLEKRAAKFSGS
jgi:2-(1,2-epoxy-1,2-dihydrophenyl)acetyl-CoA isomerase